MNLLNKVNQIHKDCHKLILDTFGEHFKVSGNIGIFCQSDEEYEYFSTLAKELTKPSDNPNQKYFELIEPIIINAGSILKIEPATYTHIYIRKFDPTPYGKYLGDIDFIVEDKRYEELKIEVQKGKYKNAKMYDRPGWNTIQIEQIGISSIAYLSTKNFAEKVRVKFD